jgi:hypothetical protein
MVEHLGRNCGRRGREGLTTPASTQNNWVLNQNNNELPGNELSLSLIMKPKQDPCELSVHKEQSMIDKVVTFADPITTAIIVFVVVLWGWPRLKVALAKLGAS